MAPVARAIQKIAIRDIFRSRNFSANPNPKGTNNKTFRKISSGPPIFVAWTQQKWGGITRELCVEIEAKRRKRQKQDSCERCD